MTEAAARLTDEAPWPGLASFSEDSRAYFRGREQETEELLRLVEREVLTSLFGKSGLGKTSLLQAGLYPELRSRDYLPVHLRLVLDEGAPPLAEQVLAACRVEAKAHGVEIPDWQTGQTLWEYFQRRGHTWWSGAQPVIPVLVFDQFEEIFSLGRENPARKVRCERLIDELTWLIEGATPPEFAAAFEAKSRKPADFDFQRRDFRVLFSFREDYLAAFETLRTRLRSLFHSRLRLEAFTPAEAQNVLERVAARLFAPGVIGQVVDFVARRAGAAEGEVTGDVEPAILSLVCQRLNRLRGEGGLISDAILAESRDAILRDFYLEATGGAQGAALREFIENDLITEGGFRVPLPLSECLKKPGVSLAAIRRLEEERLLRVDPSSGVDRVELIHDVLVEVVRASRDARVEAIERRRLEAVAARARRRTRLAVLGIVTVIGFAAGIVAIMASLVQTARQERLAALAQKTKAEESGHEANRQRAAADLSRDEAQRRTAEAEKAQGEATVALQVAEASARRARAAEQRAQSALAESIAWRVQVRATEVLSGEVREQSAVGFLLAAALTQIAPGRAENLNPLLLAREKLESARWRTALAQKPTSAALAPGGGRFAAGLEDGNVVLGNLETGAIVQFTERRHMRAVQGLAFSQDGRYLVSSSNDDVVQVWDVEKLGPAGARVSGSHRDWIRAVALSPDGKRVVSGGDDGAVIVRETGGRTITPMGVAVTALQWSANGKFIASGNGGGEMGLRDPATGIARLARKHHERVIFAVALSPDDQLVASGSDDHTVVIADTSSLGQRYVLRGHKDSVRTVAFSPDGAVVASGGDDNEIIIWDVASGKLLRRLSAHTDWVRSLTFTPDGALLLSAGDDGRLRLWDTKTWTQARDSVQLGARWVYSIALSRDGRLLASAGNDNHVRIRDFATMRELAVCKGHGGTVNAVRFLDDQRLVSASADRMLRRWRFSNTACTAEGDPLPGHPGEAVSLAVNADGSRIGSGSSRGGGMLLWDTASGRMLAGDTGSRHGNWVMALAISQDGRLAASGGADRAVMIWDLASGKRLHGPLAGHTGAIRSIAFSRDGRRVLSGGADGTVRLWDAVSGKALGAAPPQSGEIFTSIAVSDDGRQATVTALAGTVRSLDLEKFAWLPRDDRVGAGATIRAIVASPDGDRAVVARDDNSLILWQRDTRTTLVSSLQGGRGMVGSPYFVDDGKRLIAASEAGIQTWDSANGRLLSSSDRAGWPLHPALVTSLHLHPSGHRLVAGGRDGRVREIAAGDGRVLAEIPTGAPRTHAATYSPDGRWIAAGAGRDVHIWNAESRVLHRTLAGAKEDVLALAWSPDGQRIAAGADRSVHIWTVETGAQSAEWSDFRMPVRALAWHADGRRLAVGADNVRIRDATNGNELARHDDHAAPIYSLAWSPDGNRLASGSFDDTARLWDPATGASLVLRGHRDTVNGVAWLSSEAVLTASDDRSVRRWNALTGAPLGSVGAHAGPVNAVVVSGTRAWSAGAAPGVRPLEPGSTEFAGTPTAVARSGANRLIVGTSTGQIAIVDAGTLRSVRPVVESDDPATGAILRIAASVDGRSFFTTAAGDAPPRVWRLGEASPESRPVRLLPEEHVRSGSSARIALSPDGRIVAIAIGSALGTGNLDWNRPEITLERRAQTVTAIVFRPDGRALAAGHADGSVGFYGIDGSGNASEVGTRPAHLGQVRSLAFSSDGQRLITGGEDGEVAIWDFANARRLGRISGQHRGPVLGVAIHPDGQRIAISGNNGQLRQWNLSPADIRRELCRVAGRTLTPEEWRRHVGDGVPYRDVCANAAATR